MDFVDYQFQKRFPWSIKIVKYNQQFLTARRILIMDCGITIIDSASNFYSLLENDNAKSYCALDTECVLSFCFICHAYLLKTKIDGFLISHILRKLP